MAHQLIVFIQRNFNLNNTYIMESYHRRKKELQETYGKLITLKPFNDDDIGKNTIASHRQQQIVKQLRDISDEEGLKRAYDTKDGLYQH